VIAMQEEESNRYIIGVADIPTTGVTVKTVKPIFPASSLLSKHQSLIPWTCTSRR